MRKLYFSFFFLIFGFMGFSQTEYSLGYIVSNNGDTLKGFLKNEENIALAQLVKFRRETTDKPVAYSPTEIQAFGFDEGRLFRTITYTDVDDSLQKQLFGKVLLDGYYSVYRLDDKRKNYYYIKGPVDSGYLIYDYIVNAANLQYADHYKNDLFFLARSCGSLQNEALNVPYLENAIMTFIKKLNACISPSSPSRVYYKKNKNRLGFSFYAGGFFLDKERYQIHSKAMIRFYMPVNNLSLNLGAAYTEKPGNEMYHNYGFDFYRRTVTHLFSIPLELQYNFTKGRVQPFVYAGASYSFQKLNTYTMFNQPRIVKQHGLAPSMGAGLEVAVFKMVQVKTEWRYELFKQFPTIGIALKL